jgi:virginiamycin B lyase
MRTAGICLILGIILAAGWASDPPKTGVRTPGVRIPFASLKSELAFELDAPPGWIAVADAILVPSKDGLARIDPKTKESKFGEPIAGLNRPCAGLVSAFSSLWVPNCGDGTLARIDTKTNKVTATLATGTRGTLWGVAANADSVWLLTDKRGTVSRIDPVQNVVVAEFRVYADCNSLVYGEAALWLTCPAENVVLRVDSLTNLVDKSIEVSPGPAAIALGEGSVWVLCVKEGKVERIDPKTNKPGKTIELGAPAKGGAMTFGEGSLWVSMPGFPLTRIDPQAEKVVQQFYGEGAGVLLTTANSLWLADSAAGKVTRYDTRRIAATLAE